MYCVCCFVLMYCHTVSQAAAGVYINRVPFPAEGGWVASVNARSPPDYGNYSFLFFTYLNRPSNSWTMVLDPAFGACIVCGLRAQGSGFRAHEPWCWTPRLVHACGLRVQGSGFIVPA